MALVVGLIVAQLLQEVLQLKWLCVVQMVVVFVGQLVVLYQYLMEYLAMHLLVVQLAMQLYLEQLFARELPSVQQLQLLVKKGVV